MVSATGTIFAADLFPLGATAMTETDENRYRREAEECRRLAAKAVSPIDRDRLHRMADEWLKLAQGLQDKSK